MIRRPRLQKRAIRVLGAVGSWNLCRLTAGNNRESAAFDANSLSSISLSLSLSAYV